MREILFRGKTNEGRWVEGFYLVKTDPELLEVCNNG